MITLPAHSVQSWMLRTRTGPFPETNLAACCTYSNPNGRGTSRGESSVRPCEDFQLYSCVSRPQHVSGNAVSDHTHTPLRRQKCARLLFHGATVPALLPAAARTQPSRLRFAERRRKLFRQKLSFFERKLYRA